MKTLNDFNFENKRVLVRCDFNVALDEKGKISEDFRIKQTLPTIEYLTEKRAKIILMSHLDEPKGEVSESLRLEPIKEKLSEFLGVPVIKTKDCVGQEVEDSVSKLRSGEILLLENLRFHKEEEENDKNFAQKLARIADFYVNDAFSACHRSHTSTVGLAEYLPAAAGLLLEKEIKILSEVLENPRRPLVVIIGGLKIATKIGVISQFSQIADHLLLGGEVANAILIGKGLSLGKSLLEDEKIAKEVKKIDITSPKIHLPVDGIICLEENKNGYLREGAIGTIKQKEKIFDIGPETVKIFSEIIKQAKIILWAGPLGLFEDKRFENGTKEIAEKIAENKSVFKILGGGDTIAAVNKLGLLNQFDHVSTGGGAMLEFLSGKKLPGIEALK
jgi:phosphoglycerate kinase